MEPDGPPFWSQPPTGSLPRRRRAPPTPLINPVALILAIPILILLILFFLLPPFLSHTNQLLRPNSVKKSWDSFNILLVLFAIICGVFARWNDEAPTSDAAAADGDRRIVVGVDNVSSFVNRPRQSVSTWMDFPDRREYSSVGNGNGGGGGLRRSSSSYPDLRQESLWEGGGSGNRSRFFDDFEVNFYRTPPPENFELRPRRSHEAEREDDAQTFVKEIPVDKFEVSSAPPLPTTPPPPPPPPPAAATLKRRRSVHSVPRKGNIERRRDESEISKSQRPVPPPAPPPPPPAVDAPEFQSPEEVSVKIHRKKSGTREFATVMASLRIKRKKRMKSRNIYNSAAENSSAPSIIEPQSAPPPPPPPPPPAPPPPASKVLQNLFKKSSKSKRVHSVPPTGAPPPPPPPPPPNSIFNNLFKTGSKSKRFQHSSTAPPPPPPPPPPSSILNSLLKQGSKSRRFKNVTTSPPQAPPPPAEPPRRRQLNAGKPPKPTKSNVTIAPPSPLIPLPPPPPPPPFRMPEVNFVARGDYVSIRSEHSSRCSSPELEDVDVMSVKSDGGDSVGLGPSISCPSPDVNSKADSFIARLRDEWRLEKMNSMKEKRRLG